MDPASPNPAALSVDAAAFSYGGSTPVIDDITATAHPGRVTALLGPNAAGKSTLLRLMAGLIRPGRGRVTCGDRPVSRLPPRDRARRIALVPQGGGVEFAYTVEQAVSMARLAQRGVTDAMIDQAIGVMGLAEVRGREVTRLSGGQWRRVIIARALAGCEAGAGALLMDEPTAGLDLTHAQAVMTQATRWARAGRVVVVTLHDLNAAAQHADDVWLLAAGRLAAAGPWDQVLTPDVLEPVYGVRVETVHQDGSGRPTFRTWGLGGPSDLSAPGPPPATAAHAT